MMPPSVTSVGSVTRQTADNKMTSGSFFKVREREENEIQAMIITVMQSVMQLKIIMIIMS